MKKILLLCLIGLLSGSIFAKTNISGTIASDSVLTLANSPYIVNGSLDVYGCTLTMDSGVVVRFTNGTYLRMHGGAINARWTVFTSSKDTSGGNPQKGDWICIQTGTDNASSAIFDTCQINYGGSNWGAALFVTNSSATLAGTSITNSSTRGIYLNNTGSGSVVLSGATISHCDLWGLELTYGTSATITNSTISSCSWPIMEDGTASLVFNGTNNLTGNTNDGIYMNYNYTDSMVLDISPGAIRLSQ